MGAQLGLSMFGVRAGRGTCCDVSLADGENGVGVRFLSYVGPFGSVVLLQRLSGTTLRLIATSTSGVSRHSPQYVLPGRRLGVRQFSQLRNILKPGLTSSMYGLRGTFDNLSTLCHELRRLSHRVAPEG